MTKSSVIVFRCERVSDFSLLKVCLKCSSVWFTLGCEQNLEKGDRADPLRQAIMSDFTKKGNSFKIKLFKNMLTSEEVTD